MSLERAILDTLRYSAQFKYPLKSKEIHKYLIGSNNYTFKQVKNALLCLVKDHKITKIDKYYLLHKKPSWVKKRLKSEKLYEKIFKKVNKDLSIFKKIFFIKFVGITGSVAAKNITTNYDIDLFFIMKKNFLWIGRFYIWAFLKIKKIYRFPYCPNILISEDSLAWKNKNIYVANEIVRMHPFINKDNTYELFLTHNLWVLSYLPNYKYFLPKFKKVKNFSAISLFMLPLEILFFVIQYLYMRPKITTEKVSFKSILFFKKDYSKEILKKFYQ